VALNRVWIPSPNYSTRGGAGVRLIVIHTAEGSRTIESLGNFFASSSSGVSSHTGADDKPNTVGEYVRPEYKAWTQGNANPVAVAIELCAFAAWSTAEWNGHMNMLANCAAWIAEEAARFALPIKRLTPAEAQGSGRGVCQHIDLGSWGGGHVDCGPGFPMDQVLLMAGGALPPATPTPTETSGENMILVDPKTGGTWCVASREGAIYTVGPAPYLGATNNTQMNKAKYPCVGIGLRPNDDGYRLVLDWGAGKGDQSADGTGTRFRTYDFPRNGSGKATGGTY
jgi:hypothetical protein